MSSELKKISHPIVIIGAGPAGLRLLEENPTAILFEADNRLGGRVSQGSLHLLPEAPPDFFENVRLLKECQIHWERKWLSLNEFDFDSSEWHKVLPQWELYAGQELYLVGELKKSFLEKYSSRIFLSEPVRSVQREADLWMLQSASYKIFCERLFWAAGMQQFQSAYGKKKSQTFLTASPYFEDQVREHTGGLSLNWKFSKKQKFGFDQIPFENLLALPVKHQKLYFLAFVTLAVEENCVTELKSLVYLPDEFLLSPKEILSLQKSLRRTLKQLLVGIEGQLEEHRETLVQNTRLLGHQLSLPWVLNSSLDSRIEFFGDECINSSSSENSGLRGIF